MARTEDYAAYTDPTADPRLQRFATLPQFGAGGYGTPTFPDMTPTGGPRDLSKEWWNQGKPSDQWSPYPPRDFPPYGTDSPDLRTMPAPPTVPAPPATPSAPANPDYDANVFSQGLTALYQKYYNRDPTVAELASHRGNPGGLAAIEKMLAATPNQSLEPNPNKTTSPFSGAYQPAWRNDPGYIGYMVSQWANQPGTNPSLKNDPNYWIRRITETGGLGPDNTDYWLKLAMRPEGAPEGGGTGGTVLAREPGGGYFAGAPTTYTPPPYTPSAIFGAGSAGGATSGQGGALYDLLMKRATQSLDVNPNDPIIERETDAFNAQQTRNERNYLSGLAERAGPTANIGAETRMAAENVGQSTSAFEAVLMQQELTARRTEIQNALNNAQWLLTAEQQMQLTEELAQLDRAQQQYQWGARFGQDAYQFGARLGQDAYQYDATNQRITNLGY